MNRIRSFLKKRLTDRGLDKRRESICIPWRLFLLVPLLIASCAGAQGQEVETTSLPATVTSTATVSATIGLPTATLTSTMMPTQTPAPTFTPVVISVENATDVISLHILSGHSDDVTQVAFSPNNDLVASSSNDMTVRLWRVSDGSLQYELSGHTDHVLCLAFSSDGTLLASGSDDRTVRIWQVNDGALVRTIDTSFLGRVLDIEFSPDGSLIAIAGHLCFIELRHARSGILWQTLAQPKCVARRGGSVAYWGMAFSPDGSTLLAGEGRSCCGGSLQLWHVDKHVTPQLLQGYTLHFRDLVYSPDGTSIAAAFLGSSVFWLLDADSGRWLHSFEGHTYRVNSLAFSPDGLLLASGSKDQKVRLWRVSDGELLHTLEGHSEGVNSVALSADGHLLASGSDDDTVILWSLK